MTSANEKVAGKVYPTVEIAGAEYTLKPIPAIKAFDLADLIEMGFNAMHTVAGRNGGQIDANQMATLVVSILKRNKPLFLDLFAHVLGVKQEEFNNGQRFPLNTFVIVANALGEHPDVTDFFDGLRETMEEGAERISAEQAATETPSPEPSDSSESTEVIQDGATSDS